MSVINDRKKVVRIFGNSNSIRLIYLQTNELQSVSTVFCTSTKTFFVNSQKQIINDINFNATERKNQLKTKHSETV